MNMQAGKNWVRLLALVLGLWLLGGCAPVSPPDGAVPTTSSATGIAGKVSDRDGAPATGAFVYAYRSAKGGLRGPADFEAPVGEDGSYFLDLVEGRYHLVARASHGGAIVGPPRPGDAWALYPKNPVEVFPGQVSRADFILQGITQPMLMRQGTLTSGDTGFSGRVVDSAGKPVPGAFAMAYRDQDFRRMPDFTSPAVGEDGRFVLYVPEPGSYCLAVRTRTRGQPMAGELYGVLGEGSAGCRRAGRGEVVEIGTIVVSPYRR